MNSFIMTCLSHAHHKGVALILVLLPPAHAIDGEQHADGAEAEYVPVGAEGSHRPVAGPHGAKPAVSLPAGQGPVDVLTRRRALRLAFVNPQTHRRFQRAPR